MWFKAEDKENTHNSDKIYITLRLKGSLHSYKRRQILNRRHIDTPDLFFIRLTPFVFFKSRDMNYCIDNPYVTLYIIMQLFFSVLDYFKPMSLQLGLR